MMVMAMWPSRARRSRWINRRSVLQFSARWVPRRVKRPAAARLVGLLQRQVRSHLRARNAASGGEEMLRLRAYEKLQNLVARGAVKKNGKKYKGLPSALANAIAPHNGHLAGVR